jgi:hypothetical protein
VTPIEGLVLCRVQGERLAVRAAEVDSLEAATAGSAYAAAGFGSAARPPDDARALRHGSLSLAVDSLEVFAQPVASLAVPDALRAAWGGALDCFVECDGALWPVVSLRRLAADRGLR